MLAIILGRKEGGGCSWSTHAHKHMYICDSLQRETMNHSTLYHHPPSPPAEKVENSIKQLKWTVPGGPPDFRHCDQASSDLSPFSHWPTRNLPTGSVGMGTMCGSPHGWVQPRAGCEWVSTGPSRLFNEASEGSTEGNCCLCQENPLPYL